MSNRFLKMSEKQLVDLLNHGNLSHQDFLALKEAMERKGMKGMIMCVGDDDSLASVKAAREYIKYHRKIPAKIKKKDLESWKKALFNSKADLEDKKIALVALAHVATVEVFEILKKFNAKPHKGLKIWSELAVQECRAFLKSDLFDEPAVNIGSLSGTKGDKMRFYFILKTLDGELVTEKAADLFERVLLEGADYFDGELERLEFGNNFVLASVLLPFDVPPADFAQAVITVGNREAFLWHGNFYVNNTHYPKRQDIKKFLENKSGD